MDLLLGATSPRSPFPIPGRRRQKDLLLRHGVLDRDFDLDAWIDRRPIEEATRSLQHARAA